MSLTVKILGDASHFSKTLGQVENKMGSLVKGIGAVGTAAAAAGAGFAAWQGIEFLKDSSKKAAEFESLATSFEVLTGSAEKASKLLKEITEFGAQTPLEQGDLQKATQTLLAFGVELGDVMPTLRMLGDVSMGNAERLKGLALVFGQVSANGKLMGGDVLQMVNQGFNPLLNISKRLNISMVKTREMMEKGEISVKMVRQAFIDATTNGGQFEGMLAKIAQTTEGKLSNTADAIAQLKIQLGTGFNEGLKTALDQINAFLPTMTDSFRNVGKTIGTAISAGIEGNQEPLKQIGIYVGEVVMAGIKTGLEIGANKLGAKSFDWLMPLLDPSGIGNVFNVNRLQNGAGTLGQGIGANLETPSDIWSRNLQSVGRQGDVMSQTVAAASDAAAKKAGVLQGAELAKVFREYANKEVQDQVLIALRGIQKNTSPKPLLSN